MHPRTTRAALLTAALGGLGQTPAPAQAPEPPARVVRARDFLDTFGANIHLGDNGYRDARAVAGALAFVGWSRARIACFGPADVAAWKALAAQGRRSPGGLKADVLIIGYLNAPNVTLEGQKPLVAQIADTTETLEGPNEINNADVGGGTHGPGDLSERTGQFPANYAAWARALSDWRRDTPALARVKLLAPTIASGDPADYARLPDVSAFVDGGCLHFYAGAGRPPSNFGGGSFARIYDWYKAAASPSKPVSVSEWGQTTAGKPGQGGCDEATQARYVLNQTMDLAAKGVYRAYLYQLMDDSADGDPTGAGGAESHFGIFDFRWRPKPAARALAAVKALLGDTAAPFTPRVPPWRVSGVTQAGAAGDRLAVAKSDGSTFLIVWNEPPVWDAQANTPITPAPDPVRVSFGARCAYQVYDPLAGVRPIGSGRGAGVGVTLRGSPLMIRVVPLMARAARKKLNPYAKKTPAHRRPL